MRENLAPSLAFELDRIKRSLEEMNAARVASDHEFAIGPLGIFVSADEDGQGELFHQVIVGGLEEKMR